jgi:hypothetical protein
VTGPSWYEFHRRLESPTGFIQREWQALAVFGGGFATVYLVGIFAVSPSYFYPRLITDSLYYYLKGLAFAETGHATARTAMNLPPFAYLSLPGLLRSPFMVLFRDFDNQLRAIQISNVLLVGATAVMYAYVLSWIVPRKWHWLAIGFAFGFMLLNPDWGGNVFGLLADAPYAAATIAFLILATRVLSSDRPLKAQPWAIAGCVILFAVAFFLRFSAPVLLVYVAVLGAGRGIHRRLPPLLVGGAVTGIVVAVLVGLNWKVLHSRYLIEPVLFLLRANKASVMMNLLASALPSQIVPRFQRAFTHDPVLDTYHVQFGTAPRDVVLVALGFAISATIFFGMWRARRRFVPEIAYTLAAMPVLAVMIPSTTRYLIAYEPLFWIFFYAGASALVSPIAVRLAPSPRAVLVTVALFILTAIGAAYMRPRTTAGTGGARISIGETRAHSTEVASTFGELRRYLETLPRDRTFLIGSRGTTGRWKAISRLEYYRPDSALSVAVTQRDTYLVLDCATLDLCRDFEGMDRRSRESFDKYGKFSFDLVFARTTEHAKARVYRIRDSQ